MGHESMAGGPIPQVEPQLPEMGASLGVGVENPTLDQQSGVAATPPIVETRTSRFGRLDPRRIFSGRNKGKEAIEPSSPATATEILGIDVRTPATRRQMLAGLAGVAGATLLGTTARNTHAEDGEPMDPITEPEPTPTPTEEVNPVQLAVTTPEAQSAELPFAGSLSEVKVNVDEDISDGFRTMTSELVNKDGSTTSLTLHFTAKPSSNERTNTASPEHTQIQINTIQALTRYQQMVEKIGTSQEKANWDLVMKAHAKVLEPRKPRTSPDEAPQFLRVYFLSKKDPSVPTSFSLLSSATEFYEQSSSVPDLRRFTETYANALNNATDHLGKDRRYGYDEYRQRFNTSMDIAQIANKLRQQERKASEVINSSEGFNPTKGADGVDGKLLEEAANYMPARLAEGHNLANSIVAQRAEQSSLFEDPNGEMEKFVQEWNKRDNMGKIRLIGNELGQSDSQTAPYLQLAAELIATN